MTPSPQSSPIKIPGGGARRKGQSLSPSASPTKSSASSNNSAVPNDDDGGGGGFDNPALAASYGTPPAADGRLENQHLGVRKQSVSKSRSMTSLAGNGDASGLAGPSVSAKDARARPFLFGSVGPTSLLGPAELEKCFPDRLVRVFVGTWNMNGNTPPRHLADFLLPAHLDYVPDVLVVGTQECFPERTEWEVRLQVRWAITARRQGSGRDLHAVLPRLDP